MNSGFLLINKPTSFAPSVAKAMDGKKATDDKSGPTSHDVIDQLRNITGERQIGQPRLGVRLECIDIVRHMQYNDCIITITILNMRMTQLQVRMDAKTKKDAQKVLADLGLDASAAVKVLFKQIARTKSFPIDMRGQNGFTPQKAHEMRNAVAGAKNSAQTFRTAEEVLADALQ